MLKRYSYRAYPTVEQETILAQTFGCTRVAYNKYVEANLKEKKLIGYAEACRNLTVLKTQPEYEWLKDVSISALQQTLKDATQGVKNFFKNPKKVKPPKFKKRSNRQSFRIVGVKNFRTEVLNTNWSQVKLPKMGYLKYKTERALPSKPSSVTITRNPSGEYYASFVVLVTPVVLPAPNNNTIAVDLGLTHYMTTVTGVGVVGRVENPRYYRKTQTKLATLQQVHAQKEKGSKNKEKARLAVAKQHQKISNQRKDFINKLVTVMVRENQTIITETLKINNMVKNHKLSKSIMDASWGMFLTQLTQKSNEFGRTHVMVDPFFPSSKTCSYCGVINQNLKLSDREWLCECGVWLDRDINACRNLLAAGSAESLNACISILTKNYITSSL